MPDSGSWLHRLFGCSPKQTDSGIRLAWSREDGPRLEQLAHAPYDPALPSCRQVDLDPRERHFLVVWGDHVTVHEVESGRREADFVPEEGLRRARFAPDGDRVALSTRDDRTLVVDWRSSTVLARSERLGDYLDELHWLPGAESLVGATQSNQVVVQESRGLGLVRQLAAARRGGREPFGGMAISPDGKRVFLASGSRLRCLDSESGRQIWQRTFAERPPRHPTVSPDGSRIAVASEQGVALVDAATGTEVARAACFQFHGVSFPGLPAAGIAWQPRLGFSPDGRWLAASTPNGQLLLLDPATLEALQDLPRQHQGPAWIEDLAWFADSRRLLVGCAHDRVVVWHIEDRRALCELQLSS